MEAARSIEGIKNQEDIYKKIEIIKQTRIATEREYARLNALLAQQQFGSDPIITKLVMNILSAMQNADRTQFQKALLSALAYSSKSIISDQLPMEEEANSHKEKNVIWMPEKIGMNVSFPAGIPCFVIGSPGKGKTSFLVNLLYGFWQKGLRVVFYTLEMRRMEILNRLFAVYLLDERDADMTWTEIYAFMRSDNARDIIRNKIAPFIHIKEQNEGEEFTEESLMHYYEYYKYRKGFEPDVVIVDYFQRLKPSHNVLAQRGVAMTHQVNSLTKFALHTSASWIVAAQKNRAGADLGSNALTSAKGTAAFEEDAALMVHTDRHIGPGFYDVLRCDVPKNRFGPNPTAYLKIHKSMAAIIGQTDEEEVRSWKEKKKKKNITHDASSNVKATPSQDTGLFV